MVQTDEVPIESRHLKCLGEQGGVSFQRGFSFAASVPSVSVVKGSGATRQKPGFSSAVSVLVVVSDISMHWGF